MLTISLIVHIKEIAGLNIQIMTYACFWGRKVGIRKKQKNVFKILFLHRKNQV